MDNTQSYRENLDNLKAAMHDVLGYAPPNLVDSGQLIRFDTDKPRNKTGWYVLHRLSTGGLVATFGLSGNHGELTGRAYRRAQRSAQRALETHNRLKARKLKSPTGRNPAGLENGDTSEESTP